MSVKDEVIQLIEKLSESDLMTVKRMLRGLTLPEEQEAPKPTVTPEERKARVRAGLGALAHLPGSVDDFLREKHEDTEREEERYRRRHPEEP